MTSLYERFRRLRDSFRACFERGEWFTRDEHGDETETLTIDARRVLTDLKVFCRANETTFDADARIHALLEGRREALLRIQHYLGLSDTDLMKLVDPDEQSAPNQSKDAQT